MWFVCSRGHQLLLYIFVVCSPLYFPLVWTKIEYSRMCILDCRMLIGCLCLYNWDANFYYFQLECVTSTYPTSTWLNSTSKSQLLLVSLPPNWFEFFACVFKNIAFALLARTLLNIMWQIHLLRPTTTLLPVERKGMCIFVSNRGMEGKAWRQFKGWRKSSATKRSSRISRRNSAVMVLLSWTKNLAR